jgi:tetratricopeptide (TPR) repeat protein
MREELDPLALARHYGTIGRHQAVLDALGQAGDDVLHDPESWLLRSEALRGLDRDGEAVDAARRGLELDPDDISLLDALALSELGRDELPNAQEALEAAIELEPDHPTLHAHLALTLARRYRFAKARAEVDEALRLAPWDDGVLRIRAQVACLADEDPQVVRQYVEELLEVAPGDPTGHAILGTLAANKKDYRAAAHAFAEAARHDPTRRDIADTAREAKVYAHPVLAPVRPVWRFGRWRAYFVFLALSATLAIAHQTVLREVLICAWLVILVLSWFGPPILRRLHRRKYGG